MKRFIITLVTALALCLPATAQTPTHDNEATPRQADGKAGADSIVAYSDTTAADTAAAQQHDMVQGHTGNFSLDDVTDPFKLIAYLATIGVGGVIVAIFFVIMCLLVLFSPVIVIVLILYLLFRRRKERYRLVEKAMETGHPLPEGMRGTELESSEVLWRKGVKNFFIGLGLIAVFLSFDWDVFVGIGALVALYGAGQAVIAYTTRKKDDGRKDEPGSGL